MSAAPEPVRTVVIVLGAGSGERLGAGEPKAFIELEGRSLLARAAGSAAAADGVDALVVVVPAGVEDRAAEVLAAVPVPVAIVAGGSTRQGSVAAALFSVPDEAETIVCHDAARAIASPRLFGSVLAALSLSGPSVAGVVPIVPLHDTIKHVDGGRVLHTPPRAQLVAAQTPQAFRAAALRAAHDRAAREGATYTDDAAAVEAAGGTVLVVPGEPGNVKITDRDDFERARLLLAGAAHG